MKKKELTWQDFSPPFAKDTYSNQAQRSVAPFFTNLDKSVYVPLIFSPEVIGALCSRTSRAKDDLRKIFLDEYLTPFLKPNREKNEKLKDWKEKQKYGQELSVFISFLRQHPVDKIFSNPRARSFYAKWLAQYGDDSIAQMAGTHIVYSSLSQIAIKHFEDQRIGLAPIEKSTRYVDFSHQVNGHYAYYTDPTLAQMGLEKEYRAAMDGLFDTYLSLLPKLQSWLQSKFPDEKPSVVEKKAFDTLRGLLPTSTLSQVAFFGNGQAFEYLVARSLKHRLGEIRWAGERAYQELYKVTPSFLRRIKDPETIKAAEDYQNYMAGRGERVSPKTKKYIEQPENALAKESVRLVEFDHDGQEKVITGMLYNTANNHDTWENIFQRVRMMTNKEKQQVINAYFRGRTARWQKVGRALENSYVRFEVVMNIGAWRDLHRHRMLTQQRQHFSCEHGYDLPPEVTAAGLDSAYKTALEKVESVYTKIANKDRDLAQYAVTLAHRLRFMQWQNIRECFWEIELRTIPEGHPDYRRIEQQKFKLLEQVYPLLTEHMHVNMDDYDFARRGQEEKIEAKLKSLEKIKT